MCLYMDVAFHTWLYIHKLMCTHMYMEIHLSACRDLYLGYILKCSKRPDCYAQFRQFDFDELVYVSYRVN